MTKHSGGATIDRGPAPERDEAGKGREKGGAPSPRGRQGDETSPPEGSAPVDLDSAHDRAS